MYSPRQVLARSVRLSLPDAAIPPFAPSHVAGAERALGRPLPRAFVSFTQALAGRFLPGVEVFRLAPEVDDHRNLVEVNLRWRSPRRGCGLPADLVAFAPDGAGDLFCFDLRGGSDDPPVVLWDPMLDPEQNLADLDPHFDTFVECPRGKKDDAELDVAG